jgi:hypothetical protein
MVGSILVSRLVSAMVDFVARGLVWPHFVPSGLVEPGLVDVWLVPGFVPAWLVSRADFVATGGALESDFLASRGRTTGRIRSFMPNQTVLVSFSVDFVLQWTSLVVVMARLKVVCPVEHAIEAV